MSSGPEDPVAAASWRRKARLEDALGEHFRPAPWLPGRHLQTIWSPLFRPRPRPGYHGQVIETPDEDRLWLRRLEGLEGRPLALLLHGLEGSARSNYARGLATRLHARGWHVAVLEFRSCSGEMNRARRLYHSGETSDLAWVVERLGNEDPDRPIYVAGVSLGGNVLLKWLGESGVEARSRVAGAAAVCPPFDLTVSGPAIDRALAGLYVRRFLRTLVPKALAKERQYPGCLDVERIRRCRSFEEFDSFATAPLHGFEDAWDYWRRVSSGPRLPAIRVPTLLVAAEDDPFNPGSTLPRDAVAASPWLLSRFARSGGHVGFVSGALPWRARWWSEERLEAFFLALQEGGPSGAGEPRGAEPGEP